jgi:hypothetical protein
MDIPPSGGEELRETVHEDERLRRRHAQNDPSWSPAPVAADHFAGTPLTTTPEGTSFTTHALPPTVELSPTDNPFNTTPPTPMSTSFPSTQSPEIDAKGFTLT